MVGLAGPDVDVVGLVACLDKVSLVQLLTTPYFLLAMDRLYSICKRVVSKARFVILV